MLFERQRDVDVIDALLADDLAAVGQRAEQRQPAIADVIAGGAVVEEPDDLEPELAMLEHLVGDQPAEVAGAGNQHALQADAGPPSPLERLAHELARRVGEDDVDRRGTAPRPAARPRRRPAPVLRATVRRVVGLVVERADEPEDDGQDAADEHGEEVVDPRAAAAEPIEALDVERERHEDRR